MKRFLVLMALGLLLEATGIQAQGQHGTEGSPFKLSDSVAVTANRLATPLHEIASSITLISREEITKSQSAFVAHLLRNVPGVDIVQSGGSGKFTSVFIRGSNAHHALVLLDGIPLNDPSSPNNAADLSSLLTSNVERIEILRGSQSVLYGPEAIGGVVQIFTKAGEKKSSLSAASEGGTFGSYNFSGAVSGIYNKLGYSLSAERLKTNGVSSADGASERDGYVNTNLSSRLDFSLNQSLRLNLIGRFTNYDSDLDKSSGVFDDPDFITSQTEQQYQIRLVRQNYNSIWNQQLSVYFGDIKRTTFDDFDNAHPNDSEATTTTGQRTGASFQQSVQISQLNKLSMGIETEKIAFTSDLFFRSGFGDFADTVDEKHSWTRGLFLFDQFQFHENLYLTLGGRLDEHKQFGTTGTYRLTAAFLPNNSGTRLRGVIGTGYKAPSVFQLYHPSPYIGNPNLKPEKNQSWEIGLDQEFRDGLMTFAVTYFDNEYKDLIVGIENVDEATARGIETGLHVKSNRVSTRLDYTYCDSKDKISEDVLIRRPKHKVTISSEYQLTGNLLVRVSARHTGEREDLDFSQFPAPRLKLEKYTVFNIGAAIDVSQNLTVTGRIENLFDTDYQEVYSYGSSPLSVFAGIRLSN
ncbi:MAG TPA: TonB-dependent receptor [candidate division Zixibacteria bacterium]|nr:TonB-dependent receptor [candidate division Zixibacteria bacterium]